MAQFPPRDPLFEERVRSSFALQRVMTTIGAQLSTVQAGLVEIELPFREDLTQQDGYIHAGITTTIVDSACGYAALSLMPEGSSVLTVEYKVNFVAPAIGETFIATGRVVRSGRTLTLCIGEVIAIDGEARNLVAVIQTTMMRLAD